MSASSLVNAGLFEDSVSGKSTASSGDIITPNTTAETGEADGNAESAGVDDAGGADMAATTETAPDAVEEEVAPTQTVVERIVEVSGLTFDLNGHLRADLFAGKMPDYSRGEIKSGYGELALKLRVSKGAYGDAFGEVRFQAGYLGDDTYMGQISGTPPKGTQIGEFDTRVKLREAYVNAYIGPLDLRFGHQIIVWGRADGINPTNNLTPMDLRVRSPEEDDRRLGNLALRANLNFSPIRLEGIWIPFYTPSYLPRIDIPDVTRFQKPDYPITDLAKGTVAARFHLLLPAFEASVSYLHGYSPSPGIGFVNWNLTGDSPIFYVRRAAYDQHVVGLDFSTTVGSLFGLRGEAAYRYPVNYKTREYAPRPDLYYVLGVDREFGPVSVIAQYIGRYVFDWKVDEGPESLNISLDNIHEISMATLRNQEEFALPRIVEYEIRKINRLLHGQKEAVQHGLSARIAWTTLHDTLSLVLFGMLNVSTMEWVLYPKMVYSITDAMTLSVGGEIYMGPDDTLFNYIEEVLSAGYTELKISF